MKDGSDDACFYFEDSIDHTFDPEQLRRVKFEDGKVLFECIDGTIYSTAESTASKKPQNQPNSLSVATLLSKEPQTLNAFGGFQFSSSPNFSQQKTVN